MSQQWSSMDTKIEEFLNSPIAELGEHGASPKLISLLEKNVGLWIRDLEGTTSADLMKIQWINRRHIKNLKVALNKFYLSIFGEQR